MTFQDNNIQNSPSENFNLLKSNTLSASHKLKIPIPCFLRDQKSPTHILKEISKYPHYFLLLTRNPKLVLINNAQVNIKIKTLT